MEYQFLNDNTYKPLNQNTQNEDAPPNPQISNSNNIPNSLSTPDYMIDKLEKPTLLKTEEPLNNGEFTYNTTETHKDILVNDPHHCSKKLISLPFILKLFFTLFIGILPGLYRIIRSIENSNIVGFIISIILLVSVGFFFLWIIDIVFVFLNKPFLWID